MDAPKLYTVSWSIHCRKAESVLRDAKILFEKILLDRDSVAAAPRDLGIHRLPALDDGEKIYEGLYEIKKAVENR